MREISLDLVAKRTRINVSTVSRIERDLIPGTPEQRAKLAVFYGKPEDELFTRVSPEAA